MFPAKTEKMAFNDRAPKILYIGGNHYKLKSELNDLKYYRCIKCSSYAILNHGMFKLTRPHSIKCLGQQHRKAIKKSTSPDIKSNKDSYCQQHLNILDNRYGKQLTKDFIPHDHCYARQGLENSNSLNSLQNLIKQSTNGYITWDHCYALQGIEKKNSLNCSQYFKKYFKSIFVTSQNLLSQPTNDYILQDHCYAQPFKGTEESNSLNSNKNLTKHIAQPSLGTEEYNPLNSSQHLFNQVAQPSQRTENSFSLNSNKNLFNHVIQPSQETEESTFLNSQPSQETKESNLLTSNKDLINHIAQSSQGTEENNSLTNKNLTNPLAHSSQGTEESTSPNSPPSMTTTIDIAQENSSVSYTLSCRGRPILCHNSYIYTSKGTYKEKTYYRCRSSLCPAKATMQEIFILKKGHNHGPEEGKFLSLRLMNSMKDAIIKDPFASKQKIYRDVVKMNDISTNTSLKPFNNYERKFRFWASKNKPPIEN